MDRQWLLDADEVRVQKQSPPRRGTLFEVYDATLTAAGRSEPVCIKLPRHQCGAGSVMEHTFRSNPTNIFHHRNPATSTEITRLHLAHFLVEEARVIERAAIHWNHGVLGLGRWGTNNRLESFQAPQDDASGLLCRHPGKLALVMPRWRGTSLSALGGEEARWYFPRMLPALWEALSACPHGDLKPDAFLIEPDLTFFRILDPGVILDDPDCSFSWMWQVEQTRLFTTNLDYYPLLVPQHGPEPPRGRGAYRSLEAYLAADAAKMSIGLNFELPRDTPEEDASGPLRPAPADLLALGLIYFELLVGRRLQDCVEAHWPLWHMSVSDRDAWRGAPEPDAILRDPTRGLPDKVLAETSGLSPAERELCARLLRLDLTPPELGRCTRAVLLSAG